MPLLEVKISPMGESITSGILAKWHVADGAVVKKDQPLFELETDKITSEGTAESAGKISFKAAAGDELKIGQVVATLDAADTGAATPSSPSAPSAAAPIENPPSPAVRRLAEETNVDPATVAGTGKAGRVTKGDMLAATESKSKSPFPAAPATAPVAAPI